MMPAALPKKGRLHPTGWPFYPVGLGRKCLSEVDLPHPHHGWALDPWQGER